MPRFVVLKHETPAGSTRPRHWDFMFDSGGVLRTWALAEEPIIGREIAAEPLADHRLAYLDYEGPISDNRGFVTRYDRGECEILETSPECLRLELRGEKLVGRVEIVPAGKAAAVFSLASPSPAPEP